MTQVVIVKKNYMFKFFFYLFEIYDIYFVKS